MSEQARRQALLGLGVAAISCAAVLVRLAEGPALIVAAGRLCIASALLLPWAMAIHRAELRALCVQHTRLVLLAGLFLALHFVLWIASLSYTSIASSVVLVTANPVFVAVASYVLFRERLRRMTFVGIGICLMGALLIGYEGWRLGSHVLRGDALALLAAFAMAAYLLVGRSLRTTFRVVPYAAAVFSSAALMIAAVAVVSGVPVVGYSQKTYLMIVLLALVPQLMGHVSLNWALRFLPATMVTVAVLGEPVGASLLAIPVLSEVPTRVEVLGGVLILSGILVAFVRGGAAEERQDAPAGGGEPTRSAP